MTFIERYVIPSPVPLLAWEYVHLVSIVDHDDRCELQCALECDTIALVAICLPEHRDLLRPYTEIVAARLTDPVGVDITPVPVSRDRAGRWFFSPEGARYDYPELSPPPCTG